MNKLVDKSVRVNLHPHKGSPHMITVFHMAALRGGWSETEITLVVNQARELPMDGKFKVLNAYCHTYAEDIVSLHQNDVVYMLDFLGMYTHYLKDKDIEFWDEYDLSNYYSLKSKATRSIKRVFAVYSNSVEPQDKYDIDSLQSDFFDTLEEAQNAITKAQKSVTKIYTVWIKQ